MLEQARSPPSPITNPQRRTYAQNHECHFYCLFQSNMLRSPFTKLATAAPSRSIAAAAGRSLDWNPRWLSSSSSTDGPSMCDKLAFIGTGKMAQAMIRPLISKGIQPEDKIAIYDVSTSATKAMQKEFGNIQVAQSISDLVTDADFVVCAVKPQNINKSFWQQFPSKLREDATFISIMAGVPVKEFEPSGISKIVRAMPNTPAQIGEGITVWCCTPNLTSVERDSVKRMLNTFGESVRCFFFSPFFVLYVVCSWLFCSPF
jgi:uncharacterized protein YbaA (DUF1428 family)